jgi:hypothetical protein
MACCGGFEAPVGLPKKPADVGKRPGDAHAMFMIADAGRTGAGVFDGRCGPQKLQPCDPSRRREQMMSSPKYWKRYGDQSAPGRYCFSNGLGIKRRACSIAMVVISMANQVSESRRRWAVIGLVGDI